MPVRKIHGLHPIVVVRHFTQTTNVNLMVELLEKSTSGNYTHSEQWAATVQRPGNSRCFGSALVRGTDRSINPNIHVFDGGRKPEHPGKPTQTWGEHANSTQKGPGFKPRTLLL